MQMIWLNLEVINHIMKENMIKQELRFIDEQYQQRLLQKFELPIMFISFDSTKLSCCTSGINEIPGLNYILGS